HVAAVVEDRGVVDGVDGNHGGFGGDAEGGAATVARHVRGTAVGTAGLVPGAEGDPVAHRAVEVGVGHEANAGTGVGGQQPGGAGGRVAEGSPVGAAIGAELPAAVAVVDGHD